ncbi:PREDICTED: protein TIC 62, chloroplastic isoform X2 [Tarenaya hassleriana]|uniref:protein TIC 62, chloroplastic isoform X2 n=1 Tax=Tarenaya hassleriana TaxID=28532 RepID=UPI00053C8C74|nr:PREDICTED: protein TIC 62, chloroplastic isoform X2 [Tarenaya hassleriana]
MEGICSFGGQILTTIPSSSSSLHRKGFRFQGFKDNANNLVRFSSLRNHSDSGKLGFLDLKIIASGPMKASSVATEANPKSSDSKDRDVVFVAGATGKVGSRTVRELLKLGFRVKAGVRSTQKAQSLMQSVKEMNLQNKNEATQSVEKLEIVECDLEKKDSIEPALGNASVVICCIGASEKEIFDITGPYRIDFQATKNLVDAAKAAKVDHFLLVTSLGTNKFGFPAAVLNLFWGVLCWKRRAEEALIASGVPYTIVRPGGMERPTDAYKETHNLTLSLEDTLFGGQVSNLQVAELLAFMAKNPQISYCKIVEAIAETTSPLTPMEDLLKRVPSKRPYIPPPTEQAAAKLAEPAASKTVNQEPEAPAEEEAPPIEKPVEARPLSPYATYEDLKPPTSPTPSSTIESLGQTSKTLAEESAKQVAETKTRPLSPYACYDDLKPPTSPSPSASTRKLDSSPVPSISEPEKSLISAPSPQRARPLSPYAAYADLKPPTSPIPTPSGTSNSTQNASESLGGNDVAKTAITINDTEQLSQSNSPFGAYGDLKPPSSPSPTSTTLSTPPEPPVNTVPETSNQEQPDQTSPKPRPLSPYAMLSWTLMR